ncbi:putative gustatory receptor 93b [Drosophila bipectinata]|uniref:putative gustatory receptor 93b n=1 Tax=Drosophila bipectinata TaxID=42026 RepID=UPI001C895E24|nr:putative gustatory receptor 93b [Drosophila bipectinata]
MTRTARITRWLLRIFALHAKVFGVVIYRIERKESQLVARNRRNYRWISIVLRLIISGFYGYSFSSWAARLKDWLLILFFTLRMTGCLISSAVLLVLQIWFNQELLNLVNRFLELFGRVKTLGRAKEHGFGGSHELVLMSVKLVSVLYVIFTYDWSFFSPKLMLTIFCDLYTSTGAGIVMHLCFVGYLSLALLYQDLNNYVDCHLRAQLGSLRDEDVAENEQPSREAISNLDECLALYEDIHQVDKKFQRFFNLPLFINLAQSLLAMAMVSAHAILRRQYIVNLWGLVLKLLVDVLLLTLAVYRAQRNSRMIRRLSLENFFVTESKSHHMKMDLFLGRLLHQEVRVYPLGLFEVSNELTLFFLSAMITFVTFLVQTQWQKV